MNFGEILDKWERGQSGVSIPLADGRNEVYNRRRGNHFSASKNNAMESWLQNNNVYDKDADKRNTPAPGEYRSRLMQTQPDEVLDIHGLSGDKAWLSLDLFFTRARSCGFKKLRIIHGKGNRSQGEAVLKLTVRKFIEQCSFAGESGYEKAANGGSGATWVLLKQQ